MKKKKLSLLITFLVSTSMTSQAFAATSVVPKVVENKTEANAVANTTESKVTTSAAVSIVYNNDINDDVDITSKFTDVNFKNKVYSVIGKDNSSPILLSDVNKIECLDLMNCDISDLSGIEYFTELTKLVCAHNQLTSLDVSKNTNLTELDCTGNYLTSLDVSNNLALTYIGCAANHLTSLDISKNTKLSTLFCSGNNLTTLDVSNATLTQLDCSNNQITKLKVSSAPTMDNIYNPQYTDSTHSVTTSTLIEEIGTSDNQAIPDNLDITSKFIDPNFKARVYYVIGKDSTSPILYSDVKNIKELNVSCYNISDLSGVEYFTALTKLVCSYNNLTALDVSKNKELTSLYCSFNNLTTLDVSNKALNELDCIYNQITKLYVSKIPTTNNYNPQYTDATHAATTGSLTEQIKNSEEEAIPDKMDITNKFVDPNFKAKIYSVLGKDSTSPIFYSDVKKVNNLCVDRCNISDLSGIEYFTALTDLYCSENQLTTLNVSGNLSLAHLVCNNNKLTTLDVSKNVALTDLVCTGNQLTSLDVSKNTELFDLDCAYNQITNLLVCDKLTSMPLNTYNPQYTDATHTVTTSTLIEQTGTDDNTTIPENLDISNKFIDPNFKSKVYSVLGKDSTSPILYSDVNKIKVLDINDCNISDLSGIEYFKALTDLSCYNNKLTALDLSKNKMLSELNCENNQLITLETKNNLELTRLFCGGNQLTSLDLNKNMILTTLRCNNNNLTTLDARYTALVDLDCTNNQITNLYVSKIPEYMNNYNPQYVDATHMNTTNTLTEQLVTVDITDNLDIRSKFTDPNFKARVYALIGKNSSSPILFSDVNKIKDLDLSNCNIGSLSGIEYFTSLANLNCSNNYLTSLDLKNNISLINLNCNKSGLSKLDISKNTALSNLNCSNNNLSSLDLSNNPVLTNLNCSSNSLTNLDLSKNATLTDLNCSCNNLISLDLSNNIQLTNLDCSRSNSLTNLDVSKNGALIMLDCSFNRLVTLDISKSAALTNLTCNNNNLVALDVSNNTALDNLVCNSNSIASLDVSKNEKITNLVCKQNKIATLDVSKNKLLTTLWCHGNHLTKLDLSNNTKLTSLHCTYNQIKELYVHSTPSKRNDYKLQYTDSSHDYMNENLIEKIVAK